MSRLIAVLLMTVAGVMNVRADARVPQPFVATYVVTFRGIEAGKVILSFRPDGADGRYVYENRAEPSFLARMWIGATALERTVMQIGPEGVRPLEWSFEDGKSGKSKDGALKFDWTSGTVTGEIEGKPVDLRTEPNVQDRLSIQIAAVTALLRGQEPGDVPLIDDNKIKHYSYSKKEPASLDTKIGKVDSVIYESSRANSNRMSRFWLVPSLEYVPVRMENWRKGKMEVVMVLTALRRGADAAP
jgi:hypothetical protein